MRRITCFLHGIFAIVFVLGSWVQPVESARIHTPDGEKIRLTLWNASPSRTREGRTPGPNLAEMFDRANPDIAIVGTTELSIEGAESSKLLAIAGGTAPDIFDEFGRTLQNFAEQGFLYPLDEYLADYERRHGRPYEGVWAPAPVWETAKYNGKYYGIPRAFYTMQLFWRKDFMRDAGLQQEIAPQSWDELFEICMAVTERGEGDIIIGGKRVQDNRYGIILSKGGGSWTFLSFFWAAGGDIVRPYVENEAGELVVLPRKNIDFRSEHISIRGAEDYYQTIGESDYPDSPIPPRRKGEEGDDVVWRLVINEPPGIEALKFYWKLLHQPWVRVFDESGQQRQIQLTSETLEGDTVTDPVTRKTYSLAEIRRQNQYYEGVAWQYDHHVDPPVEKLFAQGKVAMLISHTWAARGFVHEGLDKNLIGTGPLPPGPGGHQASWIGAGYYGINAMTDKESRDAAWRYLEFITADEEVARIQMQHDVMNGVALFDWPSKLKKWGYHDILREVPSTWIEAEQQIMRTARAEPYCPGFQTVYEDLDMILETIANQRGLTEERVEPFIQSVADRICHHVNTRKLGSPPEEQMARLRWVTRGMFVVLASMFFYFAYRAIRTIAQREEGAGAGGVGAVQTPAGRRRQRYYAVVFLSVAVLSVAIWSYIPLIQGSFMAFYDWRLVGDSEFVGLENFTEILYNREFYLTMLRTLYYVALSLGLGFLVPVFLAIMLHEVPRGKMLFRTIYYLPAVTTGLVTMFLWKQVLYDPTADGLLNQIYLLVAIPFVDLINTLFSTEIFQSPEPLTWLRSPTLAMMCIVLPGIWAGAGPGCLIYLAALKGIPDDLYEAAEIDGASIYHKIFHITLPSLSALLVINFLGAVIGSFYAMQNIFVMTAGGPMRATHVIGIDIWFNAFLYLRFGYAVSMAWILASLLIGFTVYQLRLLNKVEFRAHGTSGA